MIDYYKNIDKPFGAVFGEPEHDGNNPEVLAEDVQFGDWTVKVSGNLEHDDPPYLIEAGRLKESTWISHMMEKSWVDMNTFMDAYFFALGKAGQEKVEIKVY